MCLFGATKTCATGGLRASQENRLLGERSSPLSWLAIAGGEIPWPPLPGTASVSIRPERCPGTASSNAAWPERAPSTANGHAWPERQPPSPSRPPSGGRYGAHQNAVRTHLREAILQMGGRDAPPTRSPGFLCMARRYPLRPPSQVSVGCPRCLVPCRGPPHPEDHPTPTKKKTILCTSPTFSQRCVV